MPSNRRVVRRGRFRQAVGSESGAELVEFALASVVFFMTVFGLLSFGLAIWQYNVVAMAAKDGARWASVRAASASNGDVQTYVRTRTYGLVPSVTTSWPSKTAGSIVTVTVQQSFTPLSGFVPAGTITLRSASSMVIMK